MPLVNHLSNELCTNPTGSLSRIPGCARCRRPGTIPGMTCAPGWPELHVPAASGHPALMLRPWRRTDIPALATEMSYDYLLAGMWSGLEERLFRGPVPARADYRTPLVTSAKRPGEASAQVRSPMSWSAMVVAVSLLDGAGVVRRRLSACCR